MSSSLSAKLDQIEQLKIEKQELILEDIQLCDEEQWYTEEEEIHEVSRRPKKSETFMIGRTHWNEEFKDEDRPNEKAVKIERSQIIEIDGQKSDQWNRIKYYSVADV